MDSDGDVEMIAVDQVNGGSDQQGSNSAAKQTSSKPVITQEDKTKAIASKEQGNAAFKEKRYAEAVRMYSDAIESDPSESSYLTNRAAAYMSLEDYRSALEDCNRANSLHSSSPNVKILSRLARCHFQLGDLDSAKSTLERISTKDTASSSLLSKVERTQQHIDSFHKYRQEKSYPMANIALDKASAEVTTVPLSWRLMRGDLLIRRGQLDKANGVASDALRLFPNDPEAHILRARVLLAMGSDLNRAVQHGQAALRADPEHRGAALLIRRIRKMERAKEEANKAFKAGATENAIRLYSEALKFADEGNEGEDSGQADGFKAILFSNRATANAKIGNHQEAIEDCNKSLELNPNYVKALRTRARANLASEKYEEAVSDFKKALEATDQSEINALKRELRSAEIDLKRSKKVDYYKILGVEKTATDAELKKAYRKESLKWHPDKNTDKEQKSKSEERFKLINEAYSVLSDCQKRRKFDNPEEEGGLGFDGVNLADMFAGGNMGGGHGHYGAPGFGNARFGGNRSHFHFG